jgi:tRNA threonylcarbamoyladenosine biosynthesis protein TsaB
VNILAVDTSHPTGSIALRMGGAEPVSRLFGRASSHLVEMGGALERLLADSGATVDDVDRVALVIGPGSFTGLRIGLSYVKGLCAAGYVDVVTMTSLELLAAPYVAAHGTVCAMVDARKSEVYGAVYEEAPPGASVVGDGPRAASPQDFLMAHSDRQMLFVGSGARRFEGIIHEIFGRRATFAPRAGDQPSTSLLCRIGENLTALNRRELRDLEPFYIRPSDARLMPLERIDIHEESQARSDD